MNISASFLREMCFQTPLSAIKLQPACPAISFSAVFLFLVCHCPDWVSLSQTWIMWKRNSSHKRKSTYLLLINAAYERVKCWTHKDNALRRWIEIMLLCLRRELAHWWLHQHLSLLGFCQSLFPVKANATEWSASEHRQHVGPSLIDHSAASDDTDCWPVFVVHRLSNSSVCVCFNVSMATWKIMVASASAALNWWLSPATRPLHHPEWAIRNDIRNKTCCKKVAQNPKILFKKWKEENSSVVVHVAVLFRLDKLLLVIAKSRSQSKTCDWIFAKLPRQQTMHLQIPFTRHWTRDYSGVHDTTRLTNGCDLHLAVTELKSVSYVNLIWQTPRLEYRTDGHIVTGRCLTKKPAVNLPESDALAESFLWYCVFFSYLILIFRLLLCLYRH